MRLCGAPAAALAAVLVAGAASWATPLAAVDLLALNAGEITGPFGRLSGLETRFLPGQPGQPGQPALPGQAMGLELRAQRLVLADGTEFKNISLHCPALDFSAGQLRCPALEAEFETALLGPIRISGDLARHGASGRISLDLTGRDSHAAQVAVSGHWLPGDGGSLQVSLSKLDLAKLPRNLLPATQTSSGGNAWELRGELAATMALLLDRHGLPRQLNGHLRLGQASLANAQGTLATDALDARMQLDAIRSPPDPTTASTPSWRGRLQLTSSQGQLYVDPVFMDLADNPLQATLIGAWGMNDPDKQQLRIHQATLTQDGVGVFAFSALLDTASPALRALDLSATDMDLARAYALYLQPFLIGSAFDSLDVAGRLDAELRLTDGALESLSADLSRAGITDRGARFALNGLAGSVYWAKGEGVPDSHLQWRDGSVYRIGLGPARADFMLAGDALKLRRPLRLPVEDGQLVVRRLEVSGLIGPGGPGGQPVLALDAELLPVSLERLTTAFDWPALSGSLSGRIPGLSFAQGELTLDGTLDVRVFDGDVRVEEFRLIDPLGVLPRLQTNLTLRNLSLEQLTSTFEIGRITGRLHGDLRDLELQNWRPAHFNARFYTPADDNSRRRISQRAIENISSISGGGGASTLVTRGLLGLFEDFSYDRMALSCELRNEICTMGGLPGQEGSYTIIRGSGLPRIDVVGFNRNVAWTVLLEQLKNL